MKTFAIILSFALGSMAHAEYKVGDSAIYAATAQGQTFDLKIEVSAVDANTDFLKITQSIISNGTVIQQESEDSTISENEQNEKVFDACLQMPADFNPRYESVSVPAGTFNTCHITLKDNDGSVINGYFANILFGVVKMVKTSTSNDSSMTMELKAITRN